MAEIEKAKLIVSFIKHNITYRKLDIFLLVFAK